MKFEVSRSEGLSGCEESAAKLLGTPPNTLQLSIAALTQQYEQLGSSEKQRRNCGARYCRLGESPRW